MLKTTVSH